MTYLMGICVGEGMVTPSNRIHPATAWRRAEYRNQALVEMEGGDDSQLVL